MTWKTKARRYKILESVRDKDDSNMKSEYYKETYEYHTSVLSEINRKAAYAGIAIVWIFKKTVGDSYSLDEQLLWPALFLLIALSLDLLQYLYQSVAWYLMFFITERKEIKGEPTGEGHSIYLTIFPWLFFFSKVICVGISYWKLFGYLVITLK